MDKKRSPVITALIVLSFFIIGNIFSYFVFCRSGMFSGIIGFKNPTGVPHIKGPSGPPPQPTPPTSPPQ